MIFINHHSGSAGNLYTFQLGATKLLVECGVSIERIRKATNHKLHEYDACLITHCHGDHSKAHKEMALAGVPLYCSQGTKDGLQARVSPGNIIKSGNQFMVNDVAIMPFMTEHDCIEPLGFIIAWGGYKILIATDTYYIRFKFSGLTHIYIECNWSEKTINREDSNFKHIQRVEKSHLSLERLKELLKANDLSAVKEIHILHVSSTNGDHGYFVDEVKKLTGIPTF